MRLPAVQAQMHLGGPPGLHLSADSGELATRPSPRPASFALPFSASARPPPPVRCEHIIHELQRSKHCAVTKIPHPAPQNLRPGQFPAPGNDFLHFFPVETPPRLSPGQFIAFTLSPSDRTASSGSGLPFDAESDLSSRPSSASSSISPSPRRALCPPPIASPYPHQR